MHKQIIIWCINNNECVGLDPLSALRLCFQNHRYLKLRDIRPLAYFAMQYIFFTHPIHIQKPKRATYTVTHRGKGKNVPEYSFTLITSIEYSA